MQPTGSPRRETALVIASRAMRAFIRSLTRVPDDPTRAGVFDRAHVPLALTGGVLSDIGKPQPVRCIGGEHAADQIIMDRRSRRLLLALLLSERT